MTMESVKDNDDDDENVERKEWSEMKWRFFWISYFIPKLWCYCIVVTFKSGK